MCGQKGLLFNLLCNYADFKVCPWVQNFVCLLCTSVAKKLLFYGSSQNIVNPKDVCRFPFLWCGPCVSTSLEIGKQRLPHQILIPWILT